jgi:hypothetical protein
VGRAARAIESDERDLVVLLFAGQREYEKKPSGLYAALCSACCVWARGSNNPRLNRSGLRQVKEKKIGCRPCSEWYDALLLGVPSLAVDGSGDVPN